MSDRARPPLDPTRTAVLVIDMQRDFLEPGAPVATPGGLELVPRINRLPTSSRCCATSASRACWSSASAPTSA